MNRYITEIINDINEHPETWKVSDGSGGSLQKDDIKLTGYGNGFLLPCVCLYVKGQWNTRLGFFESSRLELAIGRWYKNATLIQLQDFK